MNKVVIFTVILLLMSVKVDACCRKKTAKKKPPVVPLSIVLEEIRDKSKLDLCHPAIEQPVTLIPPSKIMTP